MSDDVKTTPFTWSSSDEKLFYAIKLTTSLLFLRLRCNDENNSHKNCPEIFLIVFFWRLIFSISIFILLFFLSLFFNDGFVFKGKDLLSFGSWRETGSSSSSKLIRVVRCASICMENKVLIVTRFLSRITRLRIGENVPSSLIIAFILW